MLERVESFKYLGEMIHDSDRFKDHMAKRRKGVIAAVAKIITLGLSNDLMHIQLKAEMFKVHIRPIIMYALENFNLNSGEIRKIKSAEGNALKRLIGMPTRCKSTDLFLSFDMMSTQERVNWLKLKHYVRMSTNEYTRDFLQEIDRLNIESSFVNEIKALVKDIPDCFTLNDKCEIKILDMEDELEEKIEKSKVCQLLKLAYNLNDKEEMKTIIFNLIKFDSYYILLHYLQGEYI